jgi:hypothetical protein
MAPSLIKPLIGKRSLVAGVGYLSIKLGENAMHGTALLHVRAWGLKWNASVGSFMTDQNMWPAHHLQKKCKFCIIENSKFFRVAQSLGDFR